MRSIQTNIKQIGISTTCGYNSSFGTLGMNNQSGDSVINSHLYWKGVPSSLTLWKSVWQRTLNSSQFQLPASTGSIRWLIAPANHDASWKRKVGDSNLLYNLDTSMAQMKQASNCLWKAMLLFRISRAPPKKQYWFRTNNEQQSVD